MQLKLITQICFRQENTKAALIDAFAPYYSDFKIVKYSIIMAILNYDSPVYKPIHR